ncbi:unnamed protein product [Timema podura]|uniref:Uncharacterized protein n=1 Tax=Timema podura TaxID=61482 RepID=A0ABN7P170_TIMPD|nr:unnamed protein product [Timema podura]
MAMKLTRMTTVHSLHVNICTSKDCCYSNELQSLLALRFTTFSKRFQCRQKNVVTYNIVRIFLICFPKIVINITYNTCYISIKADSLSNIQSGKFLFLTKNDYFL